MPSEADTDTAEETVVTDEAREALLEALTSEFGDAIVDTHLQPGQDLWIRVRTESWADTASYLHERQRFRYFNWLSAIDWLPSPFGRSLDAEVDNILTPPEAPEAEPQQHGVCGGDTRFQVLARVHSLTTNLGLTVKADVGGSDEASDLSVGTWTHEYPGASWHEREVCEMFGIGFEGHPGLRKLYLPGSFEGFPMRKDFPLLARLVKPWPGIVDVEPMPEVVEPEVEQPEVAEPTAPSTQNVEAGEQSNDSPDVADGNSTNSESSQ